MSTRPESLASRIFDAVKLKPMTTRDLSTLLSTRTEMVRLTLSRLEERHLVRRKGLAPKAPTGITPYLWEAA
jgi:hypothetical protein